MARNPVPRRAQLHPAPKRSADVDYGVAARVEAAAAAERFLDAREAVLAETEDGTEQLRLAVLVAREALPGVALSEHHVRLLVEQAARLGCRGQRAEVFAARVARAAAALRWVCPRPLLLAGSARAVAGAGM